MKVVPPDGALRGYDGRVIYTDGLTAALYAALTPEVRDEVRGMIVTSPQRTRRLAADDVTGLAIVDGEIRVSDCIATCRIVFKRTGARPDIDATGGRMIIYGRMPDAIVSSLPGRDMADVSGLEIMRGTTVTSARNMTSQTEIKYSDQTSYIIDGSKAHPSRPHDISKRGTT